MQQQAPVTNPQMTQETVPQGVQTYSKDPLDGPVLDADNVEYTMQIPEIRAEVRRLSALAEAGGISVEDGETKLYGLIAKDRRAVREQKYQAEGRVQAEKSLKDKLGALGISYESAKYRQLHEMMNNPDIGNVLKLLAEARQQAPAPIAAPQATVQTQLAKQQPVAPAPAVVPVPMTQTQTFAPKPQAPSLAAVVAGKTTSQLHQEMSKEREREEAEKRNACAPVLQLKYERDFKDKCEKFVMPAGPARRGEHAYDKSKATTIATQNISVALPKPSPEEMSVNFTRYGGPSNPHAKPIPGLKTFGNRKCLVNKVSAGFDPLAAIRKYSRLGVGNVNDSDYAHNYPAGEKFVATLREDAPPSFRVTDAESVERQAIADAGKR